MTLEVLILRLGCLCFNAGQYRLLKPEELDLFEIRPAGLARQRFHFGIGESTANGEARIVAHHGIPDEKRGEKPDAPCGQPAADQVNAGGAKSSDPAHLLENGQGVLLGEVMQRQAAKGQVGGLVAKGELAGVASRAI